MSLQSELMSFILNELPSIAGDLREGEEAEAFVRLSKLWETRRQHNIKDRSPEVAKNRAAVDARLAERERNS